MSLPIKIDIPDGFFNDEVRCDFTVPKKLKQIWAVELDLYKEFERVCKKYGIDYSIYWGTMLGAVRHQGFIPWDDDLDVIVDRKGFEKLLKIPHTEFGENYFLQTAFSERTYFQQQVRLRNSLTTAYIKGSDPQANNGIFLDVYVFDGVAPNRFWLAVHSFLKHAAIVPLRLYCQEGGANYAKRLLRLLVRILPFKAWWWLYSRILAMFTPFVDKIGAANSFKPQDHFEYWIYKSDFADCEDVPYEFTSVRSIKDRVPFLERRYKKYMEFPPAEERSKWHEGIIHFEPEMPYREYFKSSSMCV